ncbi:hypothetical protein GG681_02305 [Epibacterium sp. SM1969]|uniref:Uncharacterized protein n=1 Tax=Tritonibacter aquimaris TaxID=2663379 RepID=A0A844AJH2_9RHOB|nr:hypothetical protein [Tritonibacter aquimaris]MQY41460.1 hypothetical protein [Tritonibacter aquimaris]
MALIEALKPLLTKQRRHPISAINATTATIGVTFIDFASTRHSAGGDFVKSYT